MLLVSYEDGDYDSDGDGNRGDYNSDVIEDDHEYSHSDSALCMVLLVSYFMRAVVDMVVMMITMLMITRTLTLHGASCLLLYEGGQQRLRPLQI